MTKKMTYQEAEDSLTPWEKTPPHSIDAEQNLVGAVLVDPMALPKVLGIIKYTDFYHYAHGQIYYACSKLFEDGHPIDIVSVSEILKDNKRIENVGGRSYINDLAMSVVSTENVEYYAKIVKEKATLRKLLVFATECAQLVHELPAPEALQCVQGAIHDIAHDVSRHHDAQMSEIIPPVLELMERIQRGEMLGIPTGYPAIDKRLQGMAPGDLIICAARPSMGKTALATNIACNIAIRMGVPVLIYSLEMSPEQITQRILKAEAGSGQNMEAIKQTSKLIPDHLRIIDRPGITVPELRASILKELTSLHQIGFIMVDYLQIMESDGENQNIRISKITRGLKTLAREFKCPIMCLSQLSREVDRRQNKRPMLSDLRDSGSIEQDSDKVIFIYRDEYYNKETDFPNGAEVIIAKNRGGMTGTAPLMWLNNITKFINPADSEHQ